MDDGPPVEAEFLSESSLDEDGPRNDQYTGAFFPGGQNFVVAGGRFKSITNITQGIPTVPSDFRTIPMGDLDLRAEIRLDSGSGVVNRWHGRKSARRVYSARIHGSKSKMTVAVYQGETAEKEWREDISRYSWLLHPNVVQLYATASRSGIYTAVFHDELIPATRMLEKYRDSHLSTIYLYHYFVTEFLDVEQYMSSVSGRAPTSRNCMMWIRCSNGRLCVDLMRLEYDPLSLYTGFNLPPSLASSASEPPEDSQIIESTPLAVYHDICFLHLGHYRDIPILQGPSVKPGAIISAAAGTGVEYSRTIAGIPDTMFQDPGWWFRDDREPLAMEDGRHCISSSELEGGHSIFRNFVSDLLSRKSWLAQANYIFNRLGINSNYEDYVYVDYIQYQLTLSDTGSIPAGYLFLCPLQDLQSEIPSHFRPPECLAYWSLDPTGTERLNTEEAADLGFPSLEFKMYVSGYSWDESVYTGIHQFHEGKGYDPYSQDVARELGYPFVQVASELETFEEIDSCSGDEASEQDSGLLSKEADGDSGEDFSLIEGFPSQLDDAELLEPSRTWKIIMGVQFSLILASSVFCLMS